MRDPGDGPWLSPVFPRSQLSHEEIIRRLADLGWGDPGFGFRLLCSRNNMCSVCMRHYPVCTCEWHLRPVRDCQP